MHSLLPWHFEVTIIAWGKQLVCIFVPSKWLLPSYRIHCLHRRELPHHSRMRWTDNNRYHSLFFRKPKWLGLGLPNGCRDIQHIQITRTIHLNICNLFSNACLQRLRGGTAALARVRGGMVSWAGGQRGMAVQVVSRGGT